MSKAQNRVPELLQLKTLIFWQQWISTHITQRHIAASIYFPPPGCDQTSTLIPAHILLVELHPGEGPSVREVGFSDSGC